MSDARVRCSNGLIREGRICDRYPGGRVEIEDGDGERWTGKPPGRMWSPPPTSHTRRKRRTAPHLRRGRCTSTNPTATKGRSK